MTRFLTAALLALSLPLSPLPAQAATPEDTLVVAWVFDDIISLDPQEMFEISTFEVVGNVYDTLVMFDLDDTSQLEGQIAESWEVSDDGLTFTFKIRPDLQFHSGNPVTAHDVVYTFQRLTAMDKGPAFLIQDLGITADNMDETLTAPDDMTFQMVVDNPYAPSYVLNVLTSANFSIVDSELLKQQEQDGDWGNEYLKTNSAGSGPFILRQWRPDELIMVEANEDYWQGAPQLNRIFWRHITEPATQRLQLEAGDVDIARNLTPDQIEGLEGAEGVEFTETAQGTNLYMGLNVANEHLGKPLVREALRYLVDYQGMADTFLRNQWTVNQTFLPRDVLGYVDSKPYNLDVDKAKALLAEAGYPEGGFGLTINVASTRPERMDAAQSFQATLGQAGIELEILPSDARTALTTYRERKHDIYLGTWGVDYFDPASNDVFVVNTDNSPDAESKPLAWRNSWQNEELSEQALQLQRERDSEAREQGYQQLILDWQPVSPFVMMFQAIEVAALRDNVKNFRLGPSADANLYLNVTKE